MLARLVALGAVGPDAIAAERERDPSASGATHAARCEAALPDPAAKARAWAYAMAGGDTPIRLAAATADGFWQPEFTDPSYVDQYFVDVPAMAARSGPALAATVGGFTFPRYAVDAATIAKAEEMLARPDLDPILRRKVMDLTDDLRRCLAARP
jgi:aminopeptidase N